MLLKWQFLVNSLIDEFHYLLSGHIFPYFDGHHILLVFSELLIGISNCLYKYIEYSQ